MTKLGQKLVNKGVAEGKLKIAKNLIGVLDEHLIAERLELSLETVQKLKEEKNQNK